MSSAAHPPGWRDVYKRQVTGTPTLRGLEVIWRQTPKTSGDGHFSLRLAVDPTGEHLFVTSGERQKMQPAQDLTNTLGTIVRLTPDGGAAPDNPYAARGGVSAQIWSHGHRNPLGIAFDAQGRLWADEMGPRGGDEVNLIERGANYGLSLIHICARFLRGLLHHLESVSGPDTAPHDLTIVANTGDDITLFGLRVSPDIDTLLYLSLIHI